ncbi:MAG TPA: cupin domain-containing protein [Candidatus Nitrosopelagicus sp.]|jgi:dTDP-4-dehydrorhamnose 3,5-epimerase-like enzyme|nr:cupin domain-containing protein [Candidatus Nitrosopelagicus sp.]|tara:strand:- start:417 stop:797 length:381 start_codon:yes stop_codon:yes gene_type:complete
MIEFISNYFEHSDERGSFQGLVNFGNWEEINIISSEAHSIRGNHYHKYTDELFIILEGRIKITLQNVLTNKKLGKKKKTFEVLKGDVFFIKKNVNHIFETIEFSKWINVLSMKTNKKKPDINRINK